jgi:predicted  nucleic acid-binding Zn-ribbon protein
MSEEETKDLSGARNFEDRLFGELAAIRGDITAIRDDIASLDARLTAVEIRLTALEIRLTAVENRLTVVENRLTVVENRLSTLEDRVDSRLLETRPIWEAVQVSIKRLDEKFDHVIRDLYEVRADVGLHDKLLKEHERRLNS